MIVIVVMNKYYRKQIIDKNSNLIVTTNDGKIDNETHKRIEIILLGDSGVGKTSYWMKLQNSNAPIFNLLQIQLVLLHMNLILKQMINE